MRVGPFISNFCSRPYSPRLVPPVFIIHSLALTRVSIPGALFAIVIHFTYIFLFPVFTFGSSLV
jgi:hypothetical protein